MSKINLIFIAIPLFILIYLVIQKILFGSPQTGLRTLPFNLNNKTFNLEIASNPIQQAKGLSKRDQLCSDCGMIFTFARPGIYPFWMKDTLIPLDIIWLDPNGVIVTIHSANPQPNTPDHLLTRYSNQAPAQYVIELNYQESEKLGLKIGDHIDLSPLNGQK